MEVGEPCPQRRQEWIPATRDGPRKLEDLSPEETGVDPMAVLRMLTTAMLLPPPSVLWVSAVSQ